MKKTPATAQNLQKKLDSLSHKLELVSMITNELTTELNFDKLLKLVAIKAREIINAETLVIPVIEPKGKKYTYKAAVGKNSDDIINQSFPVTLGMCGWVLSNKKSLVFAKNLPWSMDDKTIWEEGMESALLIPLIARGEIVGGLSGLGKTNGNSFTQEDHDLLQVFANQVSIAIDNAKIFEELTDEKERSETTLNSIGDAVITTDLKGIIVRSNPVACKLLGWKKEDLLGKPLNNFFKIYNADTGAPVNDPVEKVISTGKTAGLTNHTVLINKEGKKHQISDSAAPIRNEHNELLGVILVFHDVTDEYALLEELRNSEQKHRRLVEHLGNEFFMFVQDINGTYTYVSPSIIECLGYTSQEYIKNNFSYLTDSTINKQIGLKFNEALNGEKPAPYEIELLNKKKEICNLRISKTPVINDKKQVIAIEGLVQNITKQRNLELSLRQSQKMEAIGQLSGGIAHDFNNQLGIVTGYLEMLKNSTDTNTANKTRIEKANKAAQRCIDLTRSLLDFSRKKLIHHSIINLNDCIHSMHDIFEHSITPSIKLKFDLADNLHNVIIDDDEFQDVMLNLILNSRDAMPDGGLLSIKTSNVRLTQNQSFLINNLTPGRYVKLSVTDSGQGISKKQMEHIFEPFFTTKDIGKGTGLGMAMIFGFINRVNGAIHVQSKIGRKTCIELYIPHTRQITTTSSEESDISDLPEGNETILLVEDEDALRELAEEYLLSLGYKVHTAENGAQAIKILKKNEIKFDLMFSDIVMPGSINGFELNTQATQLHPAIKTLMTTGYSSFPSISGDKKNILYKPYTRKILALRIRNTLDSP